MFSIGYWLDKAWYICKVTGTQFNIYQDQGSFHPWLWSLQIAKWKKKTQMNEVQTRACTHLYIEKGQFQEDTEGDDIDCHWDKGPGDRRVE